MVSVALKSPNPWICKCVPHAYSCAILQLTPPPPAAPSQSLVVVALPPAVTQEVAVFLPAAVRWRLPQWLPSYLSSPLCVEALTQ